MGRIGARRATGRRCRVTSTIWPRSTRAITRLRFCWSSRIEMLLAFLMYNILYDNPMSVKFRVGIRGPSWLTTLEHAKDRLSSSSSTATGIARMPGGRGARRTRARTRTVLGQASVRIDGSRTAGASTAIISGAWSPVPERVAAIGRVLLREH